ncbi:hypothetical protein BT67DRAFT_446322 [Trichocladium antarcticum]|uniref:Hemerythrin-like domain-containing protein n=1 Tax=Trichocladium antarcticum TaxID=1450529 RepID=A0AAN6UT35_9PEZI|nr:hypothetical protein BT67DRAFT_446322 [Trichocladium antarcticum]
MAASTDTAPSPTTEAAPACTPAPEEDNPKTGVPPTPKTETAAPPEEAPTLPPLPPHEYRIYNRLADQMDYFHDHFRQTWTVLYSACTSNRRPRHLSLKQFLDEGLRLTRYLETHHTIEETHLYPLLARKMPEFRSSGPGAGPTAASNAKSARKGGGGCELLRQHQAIHEGMDEFEGYLTQCKAGQCEFELGVLKEKMDSWGEVLFKHLDQEVRELGAEKMRKYWTLAEMRAMPM